MFNPLGTPRKLPYPLQDQVTNGNTTDNLGLEPNDFIWPDDPEERTVVPFLFSQREFTAIASSVDVGADIAYPEQYVEVFWLLVRSLRYKVPICGLIIDCIENDVDTQQAIANMLMNNQTFNQFLNDKISTLTQELIATKIITGTCDRPELAGRVKALVDAMDKANNDWFEKIETGTNSEEKFALVVGAIPGLETLPIDDVVDFAQDILEDFTEEYAAQVDGALLQEWYCGLLCVAEKNPDCSLSWGEIYQFFADRVQSGLNPFSTLVDVVNFIISGEYYGSTPIADATMALQTGLMVTQRSFFGSTLPSISYVTRDAPTSTFYEDCEECPEETLWLTPVMGDRPDSIELLSDDGDTQTWVMHNYVTGNYLTGGAYALDASAFYILDVDVSGAAGPNARMVTDFGTYKLDAIPCEYQTAKMWLYEVNAGCDVTVTISRMPCPCVDGNYVDFETTDGGFVPNVANRAVYVPGEGWARSSDVPTRLTIRKQMASEVTSVSVVTYLDALVMRVYAYPDSAFVGRAFTPAPNPDGTYTYIVEGVSVPTNRELMLDFGNVELPAGMRVRSLCWKSE